MMMMQIQMTDYVSSHLGSIKSYPMNYETQTLMHGGIVFYIEAKQEKEDSLQLFKMSTEESSIGSGLVT